MQARRSGVVGLSKFEIQMFSDAVVRAQRQYRFAAGGVLFSQGMPVDSIYFIESGSVRLTVYPDDGKELVLYRAYPQEVFAEEHLFRETYSYTAIAESETQCVAIDRKLLLQDVAENSDVLNHYFSCLSRRYHELRVNFERLGMPTAKARIMHWLTALSGGTQQPIDLGGRVKSLAADLNLTPETMYRVLADLERDGSIKREAGLVTLLSPVV